MLASMLSSHASSQVSLDIANDAVRCTVRSTLDADVRLVLTCRYEQFSVAETEED